MNYKTLPLSYIIELQKGKKPNKVSGSYSNKTPEPYVTIEAFENQKAFQYASRDKNSTYSNPGDLLIVWDGSRYGLIGKSTGGIVGSTLAKIIPGKYIEKDFLFYFLLNNYKFIRSRKKGMGIPHLDTSIFDSLKIPLPPLSEQRRIVEILDQADALRKKRAEADKLAERIIPALFYEMFGDPVTNPKKWRTTSLKDICTIVTGNTPSRKKPEYFGGNILWARPADLNNGIIVKDTEEKITYNAAKFGRIVEKGSVLVVCIGATLGKVGLAGSDMAINQQINALLPSNDASPEFLFSYCFLTQDIFRGAATQATLPILNKSRFGLQKIFIPPKEIQDSYSRRFKEVLQIFENQESSKNKINSLFDSLLNLAFSGKLTAQWREAHMQELLREMEIQVRYLNSHNGE